MSGEAVKKAVRTLILLGRGWLKHLAESTTSECSYGTTLPVCSFPCARPTKVEKTLFDWRGLRKKYTHWGKE
ncbi:hypothetical protein V6N13_041644 [Hibiscus sabdariffa]